MSDISILKNLASTPQDYSSIINKYHDEIKEAILIREVENSFIELFNKGQMNGTVHTCVGQEFSAVAVCGALNSDDWVTSNHRCHGHFISKTNRWEDLIDELRGFETGVCKGIGSSQHLYSQGFLSNGPQAALIPVGSGISKYMKDQSSQNVCVSFFGEGTLGEGLIYETMNLASIKNLPQIFVLENNFYSQSTSQHNAVSGSFQSRAEAFNIKYFSTNTWDLDDLFSVCKVAIEYSRENQKPCFVDIKTYRLNAHSKGDDDRDPLEVKYFNDLDPLNQMKSSGKLDNVFQEIFTKVQTHIDSGSTARVLSAKDYFHDQLPRKTSAKTVNIENPKSKLVSQLNKAYLGEIENGSYFIGEDILDPYGGAFKLSKGFSTQFPERVIGTPISEAAITGFGIGLSMMGKKSFVEIMFGDFISYSFDQILSNASKFYHMYAFQCSAPVRIRTPMGGKRGYGPTHSQSLEKFLLGMDNLAVFSLSSLCDPSALIKDLRELDCPAILLEDKVDYGKFLFQENEFLSLQQIGGSFGPIILSPKDMNPNITIVSYGGTARDIADGFIEIFEETGFIAQIICLTTLNPLSLSTLNRYINKTPNLVTVENHSVEFGVGAELISKILLDNKNLNYGRIGAKPYPIPSLRELEEDCLPSLKLIINELIFFKNIHKL